MSATARVERKKMTVVFTYDGFRPPPPRRYRRPFVGRTVRKALDELDDEADKDLSGCMPYPAPPYRVRRGDKDLVVFRDSPTVLREGDILIIDP